MNSSVRLSHPFRFFVMIFSFWKKRKNIIAEPKELIRIVKEKR